MSKSRNIADHRLRKKRLVNIVHLLCIAPRHFPTGFQFLLERQSIIWQNAYNVDEKILGWAVHFDGYNGYLLLMTLSLTLTLINTFGYLSALLPQNFMFLEGEDWKRVENILQNWNLNNHIYWNTTQTWINIERQTRETSFDIRININLQKPWKHDGCNCKRCPKFQQISHLDPY